MQSSIILLTAFLNFSLWNIYASVIGYNMHVAIWTGSSLYYNRRDRDLFETKTVNSQARTGGIFFSPTQ